MNKILKSSSFIELFFNNGAAGINAPSIEAINAIACSIDVWTHLS